MKRFLVFALIVLGLLFLVLAVVFFFQGNEQTPPSSQPNQNNQEPSSRPPDTTIIAPSDSSWQSGGFSVEFRDGDLDGDLVEFKEGEQGCRYMIEDLGTRNTRSGFRPCGIATVFVRVGENGTCSSSFQGQSGEGRCRVRSKAVDQAGNESSWQSRTFFIDRKAPQIGQAENLPSVIQPGQEYVTRSTVSDNGQVTGCSLLVDGKKQETQASFSPIPCGQGEACTLEASISLDEPGFHEALFACFDRAGNAGGGQPLLFEVFLNKAPEITRCSVVPTRGTPSQTFAFALEAADRNGDPLSFRWEFGDGGISSEQSPTHQYKQAGTFMPRVTVQDPEGQEVSCATAWVVVQE